MGLLERRLFSVLKLSGSVRGGRVVPGSPHRVCVVLNLVCGEVGGLCFLVFHAVYVRYFAKASCSRAALRPKRPCLFPNAFPRHSRGARLFHWTHGSVMLTLLITAVLFEGGPQFDWVTWALDCWLGI